MTDSNEPEALGHKARQGIGWNIITASITNVVRIATVATLGRLLEPRDFGLVAAALAVTTLLGVVKDIGVGAALVQRQQIDDSHIRTAFAISLYTAIALGGGLAIAAPAIADFYDMPDCTPILRAMACVFSIKAISVVSWMLCMRDLSFRLMAVIELSAYVAGAATSIICAAFEMGAWSLVIGYLVEACLVTGLYTFVRPPKVAICADPRAAHDLLSYGIGQVVFQIGSAIANQGDNLVVGHTLGKSALGFYARAYDLVRFPANVFTTVVGSVLFPTFSRLQHDPVRLGRAFTRTLFGNAVILMPASMVLVVLAPEAIRILLGPGWTDMVWPFRILTLGMLCRTSYKAGAIVARAAGDVYAVAIVVSIYAAVVVGGAMFTSRWGITGVAISTTAAIYIAYFLLSYVGMRRSEVGWRDFVRAHSLGALFALVITIGCWAVAHLFRARDAHYLATTAAVSATAVGLGIAVIVIGLRLQQPDLVWLHGLFRDAVRKRRSKARTAAEPA